MTMQTFADFMQQALYAPNTGYYSKATTKIGAKGDFITAPLISPLFGHCIALQIAEVFEHLKTPAPEIFEFGAGTGQLCLDVLMHLESLDQLPKHYHILELSKALQAEQQALLKKAIPHLYDRIVWHDTLPKTPIDGVVLANEVLDAMPVHRFLKQKDGLYESMVIQHPDGTYEEHFEPNQNATLKALVDRYVHHQQTPYASEMNLWLPGWLVSCHLLLKQGVVLLVDYGFPAHEYYHPDRATGTLMCHHQHTAHTNPFAHPGDEDITAHVNFTHVADAALDAGFEVFGYTTQASFLLSLGLLNLLESVQLDHALSEQAKQQCTQAVKTLLDPHHMGELFKVMALTKDYHTPLLGFQLLDKRHSLGG